MTQNLTKQKKLKNKPVDHISISQKVQGLHCVKETQLEESLEIKEKQTNWIIVFPSQGYYMKTKPFHQKEWPKGT